jgi:hypothetical protein
MFHPTTSHYIRSVMLGLLALPYLFVFPRHAWSEANPSEKTTGFQIGRFAFVSTGPITYTPLANGYRITLTSPTYGHDPAMDAYATIEATLESPVVIQEIDEVFSVKR